MPFSDENWEAFRNDLQNFIDSQYLILKFILRFRSILDTRGSHDHIDRFFMQFSCFALSTLFALNYKANEFNLGHIAGTISYLFLKQKWFTYNPLFCQSQGCYTGLIYHRSFLTARLL